MKTIFLLSLLFASASYATDFNVDSSFENANYYKSFLIDYKDKKFKSAKEKAMNLLKIPSKYGNKYWFGNVLHCAHIALGRIYLNEGNLGKAKEHLLKSINPKYLELAKVGTFSPQLDSFGPDGLLARKLLEKGQKEIVMKYFKGTKSFWKSEDGSPDEVLVKVISYLNPSFDDNPYQNEDKDLPRHFNVDFVKNEINIAFKK